MGPDSPPGAPDGAGEPAGPAEPEPSPAVLAAAEAARAREAAVAAYAPRRLEIAKLLADLRADRAGPIVEAALADRALAPIRADIEVVRSDVALLRDLAGEALEALRAKVGERVSLKLRSGGTIEGTLRRNEDVLYTTLPEGVVRLEALADSEVLRLAGRELRDDPAGDALALYREIAGASERELLAERALVKARQLGDKKKWKECERALRALLDDHAATALVAERRAEIDGLLAEAEVAIGPPPDEKEGGKGDKDRPDALLARLFRGRARWLPDGRVEVVYDFQRKEQLEDWRTVPLVQLKRLEEAFAAVAPAVPQPFDRAEPWTLVDAGEKLGTVLIGRGLDRLVWRGQLEGDAIVELTAVALVERNVCVTLCDRGEKAYYLLGIGLALPRLPEMYRKSFKEFYEKLDPWLEPTDATAEVVDFPDLKDKGREPAARLVARKPLKCRFERTDRIAPNAAGQASRLALGIIGGRILEGVDDKEPLRSGGVGLAAFHSAVLFDDVKIVGKIDPVWLAAERARLGLPPEPPPDAPHPPAPPPKPPAPPPGSPPEEPRQKGAAE